MGIQLSPSDVAGVRLNVIVVCLPVDFVSAFIV